MLNSVNEIIEDYSIITIHGSKELYIENYKSILGLENSFVKIKAKKEILLIEGKNLTVEYMNSDDIKISGEIEQIKITGVRT